MKTFLISIFCCLLWGTSIGLQAQTCGTPGNFPNAVAGIPVNSNPGPFTVRVFAHIIRRADGSGGMTPTELNAALSLLSQDLYPHNICISLVGTDQILDNNFYNNSLFGNATAMAAVNPQADAIDLYFCPNTSPSPGGTAMAIPNSALAIGGTWPGGIVVNTSHILAHEFGHCLGLFHTHETYFCTACVNGSNCSTCGDLVCDTPADPGLGFNVNTITCTWNGSGLDPCGSGIPYNPDELNIMSYSYPSCMSYFSTGQGERMRDHLATHAVLMPAVVPNDIFVQNTVLSSGQTLYLGPYSVTAGTAVTSGTQGPVTVSGPATAEFRAKNYISLEPGFEAWPAAAGYFFTTINPSLCGNLDMNNSSLVEPGSENRSEQVYRPFLHQSEWLATTAGFEGYINSFYDTKGDSVVNGQSWIRVEENFIQLEGVNNDPSPGGPGFVQLLSEEISKQQVYRLDPVQGKQLLYDFALDLGALLPGNDAFVLSKIDSVLLQDGYHERFNFQNAEGLKVVWVEGVGNIAHPFYPTTLAGGVHTLLCSRQEDLVIYDQGDILGIECQIVVSKTKFAPSSADAWLARILPNPTSGDITLEFGKPLESDAVISILDLTGRLVQQTTLESGQKSQSLSLNSQPAGIYLVQALSNGRSIWMGKVVKE